MDYDWAVPDPFATGHPWGQLNRLQQQMDQLFKDTLSEVPSDNASFLTAATSPKLDVREEKDHYTVRADMPGADKATIKVNVEGRLLTISGERTAVNETKDNDKVIRSERSMSEFVRGIELPGPVKPGEVSAKYDNGVLTLNLPKADESASGTQVPVH
jgi:HSP20 family protein